MRRGLALVAVTATGLLIVGTPAAASPEEAPPYLEFQVGRRVTVESKRIWLPMHCISPEGSACVGEISVLPYLPQIPEKPQLAGRRDVVRILSGEERPVAVSLHRRFVKRLTKVQTVEIWFDGSRATGGHARRRVRLIPGA